MAVASSQKKSFNHRMHWEVKDCEVTMNLCLTERQGGSIGGIIKAIVGVKYNIVQDVTDDS